MSDSLPEQPVKQRADYTEGSILGSILKMGLPSMFGFLIQHIYSLVDMYWVSKLPNSEASVAGITFVGNILWVMFAFNQLVGPGSVAVISRRYGEKQYDAAERAIKETLLLKLSFGAIFGVLGLLLVEDMVYMIGARDLALQQAVAYGSVIFVGLPVMYAIYSIFTAMRGVANPNMALGLMLASNILNLALDPLFIFGYWGFPELGVAGAAYASLISYTLTFAVGVALFYTDVTNVRLHLRGRERLSLNSLLKIIRIGVPAWLGDMSFSGARLVVMGLIAPYGTMVVAAFGVVNQVVGVGVSILIGIGLGLSSLIGHNIGGGKLERAKKTADQAVLLGSGLMVLYGLIVALGAGILMSLYFEDPETIAIGKEMLRIFAICFPFIGAYLMMEMIHQGVGLNMPTMVFNVVQSWALQSLPIFILTEVLNWPVVSVWWMMTISGVIIAIAFYFYYRRGRWLSYSV